MFDPVEDNAVDVWFRRLCDPLKHMPAEERAQIQQEVQQHLEGLAIAHEKQGILPEQAQQLALEQFGDPEVFGRQMAEEWRQSRTGLRADRVAILFGIGLHMLFWIIYNPLCALWFQSLRDAHGEDVFGFISVLRVIISFGGLILINTATGLRYPLQALKSAFYSGVIWSFGAWITGLVRLEGSSIAWLDMLRHPLFLVVIPFTALYGTVISYFASVTKRGWYVPTLDDFKLTLPKRRRQIG